MNTVDGDVLKWKEKLYKCELKQITFSQYFKRSNLKSSFWGEPIKMHAFPWIPHAEYCLLSGSSFTTGDFQNSKSYLQIQHTEIEMCQITQKQFGWLANRAACWFVNSVGNLPLNSPLFASINYRVLRTLLSVIHLSIFLCSVSVWQCKGIILSIFLLQLAEKT